jgi:hypothetical protein
MIVIPFRRGFLLRSLDRDLPALIPMRNERPEDSRAHRRSDLGGAVPKASEQFS